ncbi:MAG: hypothetical protein Q9160_005206 [Pyrenula sp. 1 TL-2023]
MSSTNLASNALPVDGGGMLRSLPAELMLKIVDELPFESLQSLRLVSKGLTDFAAQRLFATILVKDGDLRTTRHTYKLRIDQEHPGYSGGIRVLESKHLQRSVRRVILKDISRLPRDPDLFDLFFKPETVEINCKRKYLEGGGTRNSLHELLCGLGRGSVKSIEVVGSGSYEDLFQPFPESKWDPRTNSELCSKDFKFTLERITSLTLRIGWFYLYPRRDRPGRHEKADVAAEFTQMLRNCSNLISLSSKFHRFWPDLLYPNIEYEEFWPRSHVWKHLVSLRLVNLRIPTLDLENLLRNHADSLHSLKLDNVTLLPAQDFAGDRS